MRSLSPLLVVALAAAACHDKAQTYETKIEVVHVQRFGQPGQPGLMDLELRYADCPGETRRVIRTDKAFAACLGAVKAGDKLSATIQHEWNAERGFYRADITKVEACPLKLDPKEEANYEMVQVCTDLQATGATVGVHCDRTRPAALLAKCPWLKRN